MNAKQFFIAGWLATALPALAQPSSTTAPVITLDQCYTAARANYPLLKQQGILTQTADLAVSSLLQNRRLPQLSVNGQASWQNEVTRLPIDLPVGQVPVLSKDQYRLTLDASYLLFDGGLTPLQTIAQRASLATAQQQIEVELNRLSDQVNNLFMNALLTDETIRITQILLSDLGNRVEKARANVTFGTVAQMNLDGLLAEVVRSEQRLSELRATRQGLRETLRLLTDLPLTDSTRLAVDTPAPKALYAPNRPEIGLYNAQRTLLDAQRGLLENRLMPRLSLFAQTGVARPGLNLLSNNFRGLFIGGLRLNWNLSGRYTLKNDRQTLALNRQTVDVQQATFERNLTVQLRQQQTEIDRLEVQLSHDTELIGLRGRVRRAAAVQLDNGVIAARDYTTELYNENQAQLNAKLHELQLLLARIQYRTLTGN